MPTYVRMYVTSSSEWITYLNNRKILSVPASSAPVERIFSHAGLIVTAKRTRMADELLSGLVKAKYNSGLLHKRATMVHI